jgi:hypothetical protein
MDGIWIVYLFLAAIPGLIVFAAVYKYMEVSQAARWPSTEGRVVVSTAETREVRAGEVGSDDTEPRNFAKIVYSYTVGNRSFRGERVSIGENMGNCEVAETIARYPVGRTVTVYYHPRQPEQAVLERDMPPGIWKGVTIVVLVLIGLIVGSIVGFHKLGDLMALILRDPREAPFVTACIGFAAFAALVIFGIQRNVARMQRWPTVPGRIETADVRAFTVWDSDAKRRVTRHRPNIVYGYEVGGVRFTGTQVGTTARVSSNIVALVRPRDAAHAPGSAVEVHYNPENPAESVVGPRGGPLWLLWLIPAVVLTLAWLVGR